MDDNASIGGRDIVRRMYSERGEAMMNEYERLAGNLSVDGIECRHQSLDQLVISWQHGPVWPNRGNSFWVTHAGGAWHLFTWTPRGYSVPQTASMESVCRTCLAHGSSAMWEVPADLQQRFGLRELTHNEVNAVFSKMAKPA
jgi:hypothetical protein